MKTNILWNNKLIRLDGRRSEVKEIIAILGKYKFFGGFDTNPELLEELKIKD